MLLEKIRKDLEEATRKQDPLVLKTLRFILSEIHYEEIEKQRDLTDEEVVSVLQKDVKKRNDALLLMKKAGREELVTEETKKLEVIKPYLPTQLPVSDLEKIVEETISNTDNPQMGMVIGMVMQKVKGKADGKTVADLVKAKLAATKC